MLQSLLDRLRISTHQQKRTHNKAQTTDTLTGLPHTPKCLRLMAIFFEKPTIITDRPVGLGFANEEVDALLGTLSNVSQYALLCAISYLISIS